MDSSSFEGLVLDPSKCNKMSMEEKREIVYELAKWDQGAPEILQSWTRQEILQILCAEMGKERKYTGLTKLKIIENLLKIVSEKRNGTENRKDPDSSPCGQRALKRQRKNEHPTRVTGAVTNISMVKDECEASVFTSCKNLACKAKLSPRDKFCKRCSCCICRKYDDNKDPSLWLCCSSDPPYHGLSCGMSCHLDCALRNGKSGIAKDGMDGSFFCVSCGKLNDLLGCLKKQLITARETRRVDILCYRISLSQKLLSGTKRYQKLYEVIDEAVNKLETDVGPLTGLPVKVARGIVNRLSSGPEVQRLCALALESLDSIPLEAACCLSDHFARGSNFIASNLIHIKDISSSSVTVTFGSKDTRFKTISCYSFWHRKAEEPEFAEEPTGKITTPSSTYFLSGLNPATYYVIKAICYENARELGSCDVQFQTSGAENGIHRSSETGVERTGSRTTDSSSLSNRTSVEDETNNTVPSEDERTEDAIRSSGISQGGYSVEGAARGKVDSIPTSTALNSGNTEVPGGQMIGEMNVTGDLPLTPFKLENMKRGNVGRNRRGRPSKCNYDNGSMREEEPQGGELSNKRSGEGRAEGNLGDPERDFEYYVKVVRWLECKGHIDANFRQKFLTWYGLRATPEEVRVVKVFVDTLIDDPGSLAGQLVDAFAEAVSSKRSSTVPSGFCLKLWH